MVMPSMAGAVQRCPAVDFEVREDVGTVQQEQASHLGVALAHFAHLVMSTGLGTGTAQGRLQIQWLLQASKVQLCSL